MQIREYHQHDLAALRAIHAAQGFEYALPDLSNPLFVTKLILTQDGGFCSVGAQPCPERSRGNAAPQLEANQADDDSRPCHEQAQLAAPPPNKIIGAALLRLTAEAYLLLDPRNGTPRQRWQWLLALHAAAERDAWQRGLEDVHAWLPPPIARQFGKRIARLGWLRDDAWTPYCRKLEVRD